MIEERNGKIVTFYSYKGGTGRSMLLANVAWILASHRKRVLMVDWDLEAPGLHRYFHPFIGDKYLASSLGLVDWVLDYQRAVSAVDLEAKEVPAELLERHADLSPYFISIDSSDLVKGTLGALHLLPAGRQDAGYPGRFSDLDFRGLYSGLDGFRLFELVKAKMKAQYDYVLIDSRTGVGDTSSICTLQMPDAVVVCFTLNSQSTLGASSIARAVFADRKLSAAADPKSGQAELTILPVPTRIERSEKQKLEQARRKAYQAFDGFPTGLVGRDLERYWRSVEVPYEAYYAYEEVLAVLADQPGDITSVLASAERLTRYVAGPEHQELVRMPEERRLLALAKYSESGEKPVSAAERAERVYSGLSAEQELAARELFLWFVALGTEDFPFARPLAQSVASRADLAGVRDLFFAEGILVMSQQSPESAKVYELADPSLVKSWSRIVDWIKEDLPFRHWLQDFGPTAKAWHAEANAALLLDGKALEAASGWAERFPLRLNAQESEFLAASKRRAKVRRWTAPVRNLIAAPWYKQALIYSGVVALGFAIYLGVIWGKRLNAKRAVSTTEKAQQDANQSYNDGLQKYNNEDFSGAIAAFDTALKYDPKYESALLKRGAAYRFLAEYAARADKDKKQANLNAALLDLNRAVALNGGAEEYLERGWTYFDLLNYGMAATDFKQALSLFPDYPEAHRALAWTYNMQGRYAACISEADAAIKIRPNYDDGLYVKGYCLGSQGNPSDHEEAVDIFKKVLAVNATYTDAYVQLGWEYNHLKQYDNAIKALNNAIQLYQSNKKDPSLAYDYRGDSFVGKGQYKEAIPDFQKAIALGATNTKSLNDRITDAQKKLAGQTTGNAANPPGK